MQSGNAGRLADYCKLDMRVLLAVKPICLFLCTCNYFALHSFDLLSMCLSLCWSTRLKAIVMNRLSHMHPLVSCKYVSIHYILCYVPVARLFFKLKLVLHTAVSTGI